MSPVPIARLQVRPARLLEAPAVGAAALDGPVLKAQLRGVVCGVCAARSRRALEGIPGVEAASVDLDSGRATLRLSPGAVVDQEHLRRALERAVVAMPVRRLIERIARRRRGSG